jgi:hypothetical protein
MTIQSSGPISFSSINTEMGLASNTSRSIGDSVTRGLAGVASGPISISNLYGKSNRVAYNYVVSSNRDTLLMHSGNVPGYVAGKTDLTITINSGVYLYAVITSQAGLIIDGFTAGDTVTLVNNGYILGMGGKGGGTINGTTTGNNGGNALSIGFPISIINNSYIAGGGGGGGGSGGCTGGGGAGGGAGGDTAGVFSNPPVIGGAGGGPGAVGSNGTLTGSGQPNASIGGGSGGGGGASAYTGTSMGAGGGRILPGSGGAGAYFSGYGTGGAGGSAGGAGGNGALGGSSTSGGGGGGGWGATGGIANVFNQASKPGGTGGKAIHLNGNSVTWLTTGTVYGAVS